MGQEESKYKHDEFVTFEKDTSELRTWVMYVSTGNLRRYDYQIYTRTEKNNFIETTEKEVRRLKSAKVSYMLLVRFRKFNKDDGKYATMERYFDVKENQPKLFLTPNKEKIEEEYDRFVENTAQEIEDVELQDSGWQFY